jgi:hypothetical protein
MRNDNVPFGEPWSDTASLESCSISIRYLDPRENWSITRHQLVCVVRRWGSESTAWYICSSSRRFGDANAMHERPEGNSRLREATKVGRIAVDLIIEVGSL